MEFTRRSVSPAVVIYENWIFPLTTPLTNYQSTGEDSFLTTLNDDTYNQLEGNASNSQRQYKVDGLRVILNFSNVIGTAVSVLQ